MLKKIITYKNISETIDGIIKIYAPLIIDNNRKTFCMCNNRQDILYAICDDYLLEGNEYQELTKKIDEYLRINVYKILY